MMDFFGYLFIGGIIASLICLLGIVICLIKRFFIGEPAQSEQLLDDTYSQGEAQ